MGKPGWPMPPRGDRVKKSRCPIHKLWARKNEDKGKDGQGQVMGRDRQGQVRIGYGQGWARTMMGWTIGAGCQLVWVTPGLGFPDEKCTSTV